MLGTRLQHIEIISMSRLLTIMLLQVTTASHSHLTSVTPTHRPQVPWAGTFDGSVMGSKLPPRAKDLFMLNKH